MANGATSVYTKAAKVSGTALGLLFRELVLGGLVTTKGIDEFRGASNDTITIPIRARTTADTIALRATGEDRKITVKDLIESSISVQLTDRVENAVGVTDEQATLDIVDFSEQVLAAQVRAVSEGVEDKIYALFTGAKYHASNGVDWNIHEESSPKSGAFGSIVKANVILDKWNVPRTGRVLVIGPSARGEILLDKTLDSTNPAGLGDGALRDGYVGKLDGTPIVVSNKLTDTEGYLFHKSAFIFANGAPAIPKGAYGGAHKNANGFSMRWIMDYDADYAIDRSILTTYTGGKSVEDGPTSSPLGGGASVPTNVRAVKLTLVNTAP